MAVDARLPESLTELILAIPSDGWSPELMEVVGHLVRLELRDVRSPRYVGLDGNRWDDARRNELTYRCYAYCILGVDLGRDDDRANPTRLDSLRTKARSEGVGVGYLRRAVQNYLRDLRMRQAPQATAVFKRVREAVSQLVAGDRVSVVPATARLDKYSVVRFRHTDGVVVDPPTLARIVGGFLGRDKLARRLRRRGEEPTQEVWDLFDHLGESSCAAFKVGDLLDVLSALAWEPSELPTDAIEDFPDQSAGGHESAEEFEARQDELWHQIRRTVTGAKCSEPLRQRMLDLLDARLELVNRPGSAELSRAQLGAACGMSRQRASEAWQRLVQIISDKFGVEVADRISNSPSDA